MDRPNPIGTEGDSGSGPRHPVHPGLGADSAKWKIIALGAAGVAFSVAAIWWLTQRSTPVTYVTAPVTRGAIERTITATGTVNPELTIIIGSYVSGVISSMSCDYNTRVTKGQLCATVDPRPYQAALDQAEGQLARDEAQLQGARVDLERYQASLARNAIAHQTYDDQVALVKQLEGSVRLDRGTVETAAVNLGYTHIISPVDGTVVARNITIGQTVAASFQTPTLFLIATDLTKMEVDTNVSESDIGAVKADDVARFTVEAFQDR
ncbi:MAG TPA: efflux RND transporter periplasmic adaptor subunit, partial [Steroidobacteraceae bacterium]|nr:efflux RND transporter periplasmic adaptor subunit [Steroidobacteraceae bacterium]